MACRVAAAEHQGLGYHKGWAACTTCKQRYTGVMPLDLAEALLERHRRTPARNHDHLAAQHLLAGAYLAQGRHAKGCRQEELYRGLLSTHQRLFGADHENTLVNALNLSTTIRNQDEYREAEAFLRDTLPRMQQVLGAEHGPALGTARALAGALVGQGKYTEAEPSLRDTLAVQQRVHGDGHTNALTTCRDFATLLMNTRGHRDAEELCQAHIGSRAPSHPRHSQCIWASPIQAARQGRGSSKTPSPYSSVHVGPITRAHGSPRSACTSCRVVMHGAMEHRHTSMHCAARSFCRDTPSHLAKGRDSWPAVPWQHSDTRPFVIHLSIHTLCHTVWRRVTSRRACVLHSTACLRCGWLGWPSTARSFPWNERSLRLGPIPAKINELASGIRSSPTATLIRSRRQFFHQGFLVPNFLKKIK